MQCSFTKLKIMKNTVLFFLAFAFIGCLDSPKQNKPTVAAVTNLPFFNSADFTPEWISKDSKEYDAIHKIPEFSFVNQNGNKITNKDYEGKIYVADFFFTSCTGICRSLSLNMKILQDNFKNDSSVMLLSHSVTPEVDTVPVLNSYAQNYGIDARKWNLVTGDKNEIYKLAREAYFSDEDFVKTSEPSEFIHTENFLLIDGKGRIRGVYNGTLKLGVKRLIKHIELLKKEQNS